MKTKGKIILFCVIAFAIYVVVYNVVGPKVAKKNFCGTWHSVSSADSGMNKLFDLGLTIELVINPDKSFEIWSIVNGEKTKMNEGTWGQNNWKELFARIPDKEYGGVIMPTLKLSGDRMIYQVDGTGDVYYVRY